MYTWRGTTLTNINSLRFLKRNRINRYSIVNKTGADVVVNIKLGFDADGSVHIVPTNMVLKQGECLMGGGVFVEDRDTLFLQVSAEVDFIFSFEASYPDGIGATGFPATSSELIVVGGGSAIINPAT